ncbi:MAG: hypothetical protein JNN08_13585 [Bryobacterales bacterium]|nr:hypothetical protein [Bryobacterales bacterium]
MKLLTSLIATAALVAADQPSGLFAKDNLIAWCIVPFDAKQRGPTERAQMLKRLGIKHFAYDWREKDIPTFDDELNALRKNRISLDAFWLSYPLAGTTNHWPVVRDFLKRRRVKTQLWLSVSVPKTFEALPHDEKLRQVSGVVATIAREAAEIGCSVGLYNHGGWFGEPENQVAVIRAVGLANVGIVYNLHHAHHQLDNLPELLKMMKPHLLAINLNGMKVGGPKILPIGQGDRDREVIKAIVESGYRGRIGILGHREELDAEEALKLNLDGLAALTR